MPGDVPVGHDRDNICGPYFTAFGEGSSGSQSDLSGRKVKCWLRLPGYTNSDSADPLNACDLLSKTCSSPRPV